VGSDGDHNFAHRNLTSTTPVSETAVYAFVSWIGTITVFVIFLVWSLTPEHLLHKFGITYYPPKHYAIILPVYVLVVYILAAIAYMGWNMINTQSPESISTLNCSNFPRVNNRFIKCGLKEGIPDMGDIDPLFISYLMANTSSNSANIGS
jgi:PIG-P